MNPSFIAFSDELEKIADGRQPVSRDDLKNALKLVVPGALAFGVGSALGGLAGHHLGPKILPRLGSGQQKALMGALGGMTALMGMGAHHEFKQEMNRRREEKKT